MALREKIDITWDGKSYPIVINMYHIDQIEQHLNLVQMSSRLRAGDLRYSHAAKLISMLLQFAGCSDVTQEDVWVELFGNKEDKTDFNGVVKLLDTILSVIFCEPIKKSVTTDQPTKDSETNQES